MSIDKRIVEMSFKGDDFNSGVKSTIQNLGNLEKSLELKDATKGLDNISKSVDSLNLARIADSMSVLENRFSTFGIAAMAIITNITNSIVNMGKKVANALIFEPLKSGFSEYEIQMNAIQTTLANTASKGTTLNDVNKALAILNDYADKTIYNFAEMTKNIGTFTAAGIDLDKATAAIKGIANLAAISGSNSQQASTAMYQLSQALSSGTVKLMDWNSVVNAGMGGQVFQDALKETARVHGIKIDEMITKEGSFRNTLQNGWLSASILTETLQKFTGDLSEEQLKSIGYTQEQIKEIQKLGVMANDAATKVKTFTQLKDTLKEALGSGWARTWQLLIGNFDEAKKFFTYLGDTFSDLIGKSSDARNEVLEQWNKAGGRTFLIEGIQALIEALLKLGDFAGKGLAEALEPLTHLDLLVVSLQVRKLAKEIKKGIIENGPQIQSVFRGIGSAIDIVTMFISSFIDFLGDLWSHLEVPKGNKFLDFLTNISDGLFNLRNTIKEADTFAKGFKTIENFIVSAVEKITKVFHGFSLNSKEFSDSFSGISNTADKAKGIFGEVGTVLGNFAEKISIRFGGLGSIFQKVIGVLISLGSTLLNAGEKIIGFQQKAFSLSGLGDKIKKDLGTIWKAIKDWSENTDFNKMFDVINGALTSGLIIAITNFVKSGTRQVDKTGGIFDSLKSILSGVQGVLTEAANGLKAIQESVKSDILLKIAIAVGILAISLVAISLIDSAKLLSSIGAITALFASLMGSVAAIDKLSPGGLTKISLSLIAISAAVLLLSLALNKLADNDPEKLTAGTLAVGALLAELSGFMALTSALGGSGIKGAGSLILVAGAMIILATAVSKFGSMDSAVVKQGLVVVGAILGAVAIFVNTTGDSKNILASSVALQVIGTALITLSLALKKMSDMSWEELSRGMVVLGGSLGIITAALRLMPKNTLKTALSLTIISASLLLLSDSLAKMGSMSWDEIGRGLTVLAGALLILAGALYLMSGSLSGALAMVVMASALAILTPVLMTLGTMSLASIAIALGVLAGAFIVFGLAGLVLGPLVPVLLGLSAAMLLLGLSVMSIGIGVGLFATAMGVLAVSGLAGASVLIFVAEQFANAVIRFAEIITTGAPIVAGALAAVLLALVLEVLKKIPEMASAILQMIVAILNTINENLPVILNKGFEILINLLKGIKDHLPEVVTTAFDVVIAFLDSVALKLPEIIDSGFNLIVAFIDGLADAIEENTPRIVEALGRLGTAMIDGLVNAIADGASIVKEKIVDIAMDALEAVKRFLGIRSPSKAFMEIGKFIIAGWSNGLDKYGGTVIDSVEALANSSASVLASMSKKISDGIENNLNSSPVITPVLDLDDVISESKKIGSLFGTKTLELATTGKMVNSIKASSEKTESSSTSSSKEKEISFTQNNYSPKSLSRLEIYRETNNLLKTAKGVR